MSPHGDGTDDAAGGSDDGDVTLPADDDVVARIRAHAARVRSGEAEPDGIELGSLTVWTPESDPASDAVPTGHDVPGTTTTDATSSAELDAPRSGGSILPDDETVAFAMVDRPERSDGVEIIDDAPDAVADDGAADFRAVADEGDRGVSLIDGVRPPESSVSFWDDRPFRASGIDAPAKRRSDGFPLWALVALVVVFIVVASVAISLFVATGGVR